MQRQHIHPNRIELGDYGDGSRTSRQYGGANSDRPYQSHDTCPPIQPLAQMLWHLSSMHSPAGANMRPDPRMTADLVQAVHAATHAGPLMGASLNGLIYHQLCLLESAIGVHKNLVAPVAPVCPPPAYPKQSEAYSAHPLRVYRQIHLHHGGGYCEFEFENTSCDAIELSIDCGRIFTDDNICVEGATLHVLPEYCFLRPGDCKSFEFCVSLEDCENDCLEYHLHAFAGVYRNDHLCKKICFDIVNHLEMADG